MAPAVDPGLDKVELRGVLRARREGLSARQVAESSRAITARVVALLGSGSRVGVFAGVRGEVALLVDVLSASGRVLAWPRCASAPGEMHFYACSAPPRTRGRYGVPEPEGGALLAPESFDAVVVPGLAFDASGRRLGQGGGYYDRYLPQLRDDALRVGVCYAWQVVDALVTERHDVRMTHVITETNTWSARG